MSIAVDAVGVGPSASGSSLTWSHTCTGASLIIIVGVLTDGTITGVTYNGVSLSLIGSANVSGAPSYNNYLYRLVAPATGAHNVVVSTSASATIAGVSASYTGVAQTGQPDNSATETAVSPGGNYSKALTPVADNCWIVFLPQNLTGTVTAVSGCVVRQAASGQNFSLLDTNGPISPAASTTLTVSPSGATWDSIIASISPASGVTVALTGVVGTGAVGTMTASTSIPSPNTGEMFMAF